ncbi:MAG: sigma-54-dependent transcriptional regulator [Candidatus Ornithospirochaeta sp.]
MKVVMYGGEGLLSSSIMHLLKSGDELVLADKSKHIPDDTDIIAVSGMNYAKITEIKAKVDPSVSIMTLFPIPIAFSDYSNLGNVFHVPYPHNAENVRNTWELIKEQREKEKKLSSLIAGKSRIAKTLCCEIASASRMDLPIHVYGETGTGKTMSSRFIHELSSRRKRKMVYINCSNLNSSILDSDLFGHKKGAYTSSCTERTGLVGASDQSTLVLDEVGDLPMDTQGKLLDTIENGTYRQVGSDEIHRSSFRLITAGQKSLEELLAEKKLREDFYYRIKNMTMHLIPLREHPEDIPHIVKFYEEKHNIENSLINDFTPLMEHKWKGNIRELLKFMERIYGNSMR